MLARDKEQVRRPRVVQNIIEVLEGSIVGETERIQQCRPQCVVHLNGGILSVGNIVLVSNGTALKVWEYVRISIKAISREDPHIVSDLMIDPSHKIIFAGNLGGRSDVKGRAVRAVGLIRSLEEVQVGLDGLAYRYRAGASGHHRTQGHLRLRYDGQRNDSLPGSQGRHFS